MRKFLMCIMSILLVVGLSGIVSAGWVNDGVDPHLLTDFDIDAAKVTVYPHTACSGGDRDGLFCNDLFDCQDGGGTCEPIAAIPDYIKIGLRMNGKLPGALIIEADVDNNDATGGGCGMAALFKACKATGTAPVKQCLPGVDVSIYLVLDDQDDDIATAWCTDCRGPSGKCFYKEIACSTHCGPNCYKGEVECQAYDDNCYASGTTCDILPLDPDDPCEQCFIMTNPCTYDTECQYGKIRGEWYANALNSSAPGGFQMGEPFYSRGRIEVPDLPPQGGETASLDEACITLPWARILDTIRYHNGPHNANFNVTTAQDPANYQLHIAAMEDGNPGGNDYINTNPNCMAASDAIPDDHGTITPDAGTFGCVSDLTGDGQVTGFDTIDYKADYPRDQYLGAPCPSCK